MKEFCRKCKYAEEPSDKDPCKSCMDFGIAALGRPANFRETDPEMRKIGDRIEEVYVLMNVANIITPTLIAIML